VKVVDEAKVAQSDDHHRAGADGGERPSSSLSAGATDETKVKRMILI
jgi:hypothetical protein